MNFDFHFFLFSDEDPLFELMDFFYFKRHSDKKMIFEVFKNYFKYFKKKIEQIVLTNLS